MPLTDGGGRVREWVVAVSDVTEQAEAAEALRRSEAQFRTLADNIPQLAWMADAAGDIFWYNRRWFEFTGTTLETLGSRG